MRNSTFDVISINVRKIDALLSLLSNSIDSGAFERLSITDRGNCLWIVSDLVCDMKTALETEREAHHA